MLHLDPGAPAGARDTNPLLNAPRQFPAEKPGVGKDGVSIVVPAYNEEHGLPAVLSQPHPIMGQAGYAHDVVNADGG